MLPVTVQMTPGQSAVSLTVINQGAARPRSRSAPFPWSPVRRSRRRTAPPPRSGVGQSAARHDRARQPPRLFALRLRLPPLGEGGLSHFAQPDPRAGSADDLQIALRMSIAFSPNRRPGAVSHVQYRVQRDSGAGLSHCHQRLAQANETLRDITLKTRAPGILVKTKREIRISVHSCRDDAPLAHCPTNGLTASGKSPFVLDSERTPAPSISKCPFRVLIHPPRETRDVLDHLCGRYRPDRPSTPMFE